ncbi:MAG: dTDP-4-dehydrorhamnose 3,5-epimerase [Bacteroidetes bacterium]|nr:dTDP-4-dehydrorhamnose 3,5-epimerase [Bacteroidota bacterium]
MQVKENPQIKGIIEITLEPYSDQRGFLMRTFDKEIFQQAKLPSEWVQENHSMNVEKNTIRGLHFLQSPWTDGKLIRCTRGQLYDVAVDLRKGSPTLGKWVAFILTEEEPRWIYLPKGFAHGYCSLTPHAEIHYKHDSYYNKSADSGIRWNDPEVGIVWPCKKPLVSDKDNQLQSLNEFITKHGGL